ncbi:MAG: exopolysaccharide biosynthesis protein [Hydrogenophaga sp.]|jgi:hypothetical protein|nr:exopolysaccharide biosynthesis protein [Hydrogenophaga sp.]
MSIQLARRFHRAAWRHRRSQPRSAVSVQDLLHLHGESSTPVILLIMATCCLMPVGGVGTVLSFAMVALAWGWWRQRETLALPERLARVRLSEVWTQRVLRGLAWLYGVTARWLRPRWGMLTHPRARIGWAVWICLMAFLIFLPIPFGNVLPGISLMLFSLAWMFRDGAALLVSKLVGLGAVAFALAFGSAAWALLERATGWVMAAQ